MVEAACDLVQWNLEPLGNWVDESLTEHIQGRQRTKALVRSILDKIDEERKRPTEYRNFFPPEREADKYQSQIVGSHTLMGRCPCPVEGEKTRCCNLKTLDAVQQCAFGCSYCSIQSFYNSHEIRIVENLSDRLKHLQLDPDTWHIGTGQSSDSLLWGNDFKTLEALAILAKRYPDLILELKTKSKRTDWLSLDLPQNIIATWSLNAKTIIEKEEHLTATLEQRLAAARKVADKGRLVGFHLHPMVYFQGWEDEYATLVEKLTNLFAPEEVMMVSLGTLTFTKAVLRQLRTTLATSRILDMQLTEAAGKYSYPLATKQSMFSHAYSRFPASWKKGSPFFYLCMEDPSLWVPTFGYAYENDQAFEDAMKSSYQLTLGKHRKSMH